MNHKRAPVIFFCGIFATLLICFVGSFFAFEYTHLIAAVVLVASMYAVDHYSVCPHCGGHLSLKKMRASICPHCRETIEW